MFEEKKIKKRIKYECMGCKTVHNDTLIVEAGVRITIFDITCPSGYCGVSYLCNLKVTDIE